MRGLIITILLISCIKCFGQCITTINRTNTLLPNNSFEQANCCYPYGDPVLPWWNQTHCATGWFNPSSTTSDYHNSTCMVFPSVAALQPFPHGNGVIGVIAANTPPDNPTEWYEYFATCVNIPPGTYNITMQIAYTNIDGIGEYCNHSNPGASRITIFGSSRCQNGIWDLIPCAACPTCDPDWIELGSVVYIPQSSWITITINLNLLQTIRTIAIGAQCNLPSSYNWGAGECYPYFVFDNMQIFEVQNCISTPCTTKTCVSNVCIVTPVSCNDFDRCTQDYCNNILGCRHLPIICNDNNPCTVDQCVR